MAEKFMLRNVRVAFPHLFEKHGFQGQEGEWSCVILLPKDSKQVEELKKVIYAEGKSKFPKELAKVGPLDENWGKLNYPLLDGDDKAEDYEAFAGMYRISAKAKNNQPLALSPKKEVYRSEAECPIESGSYCNVSIACAAYSNVQKGVGIYLNGIQFVKAGEAIGGGNVANDFDEIPEEYEEGYEF